MDDGNPLVGTVSLGWPGPSAAEIEAVFGLPEGSLDDSEPLPGAERAM